MTGEEIQNYLVQFGITPKSIEHHCSKVIQLEFAYNKEIINIVKGNMGSGVEPLTVGMYLNQKIFL